MKDVHPLVVDNQFVNPWGFMLVDGQRGAWSQILYVYRVSESSIKPAIGENYVSSYNSTFHYKKQFFDAFSPGHFMVSDKTTHKMALCRVTESGYKILTDYGRFSGIDAVLSKDLLLLRRDGGVQAYSISQGTVSDIYREARNTKYGAILEHGSKKPGDYPDALYLTKSGEKFFFSGYYPKYYQENNLLLARSLEEEGGSIYWLGKDSMDLVFDWPTGIGDDGGHVFLQLDPKEFRFGWGSIEIAFSGRKIIIPKHREAVERVFTR